MDYNIYDEEIPVMFWAEIDFCCLNRARNVTIDFKCDVLC